MSNAQNHRIVTVPLKGRIDSNSVPTVEAGILASLCGDESCTPVFDASELEYISSAGLRLLLRLRQKYPQLSVTNVSPEIYEIFDMTGFTQMMDVEKAYRVISVDGCEKIGSGANGAVYRLDAENVVKVYNNSEALEQIHHEREMAKLALVLGLPTAISYDVVKVGAAYGSIFELLNACPMSKMLAEQPEKFDWCVKEYSGLLKKIHSITMPEGKLPKMKDTVLSWADDALDFLSEEDGKKLLALINAVPDKLTLLHGDYHTKNLMMQNDEVLLIDMDTLSTGDPIFELSPVFSAFIGFHEFDHSGIKAFQGFDFETGVRFFRAALSAYLGTECESKLREVTDKARIISYARLIGRVKRHKRQATVKELTEMGLWRESLVTLLAKYDRLSFSENELTVPALRASLPEVLRFAEERVEKLDPDMKGMMQLSVAIEEIFVNIADYAYDHPNGMATVRIDADAAERKVTVTFTDSGMPYDPTLREDPDVSLPAERRNPGGLGIFMTKKLTDGFSYEYRDGKNVLSFFKKL